MKVVSALLGLLLGGLIGLIGLFLILYQGDSASEADIYVNLA
jgi:hypothetical protein